MWLAALVHIAKSLYQRKQRSVQTFRSQVPRTNHHGGCFTVKATFIVAQWGTYWRWPVACVCEWRPELHANSVVKWSLVRDRRVDDVVDVVICLWRHWQRHRRIRCYCCCCWNHLSFISEKVGEANRTMCLESEVMLNAVFYWAREFVLPCRNKLIVLLFTTSREQYCPIMLCSCE